MNPSLITSPSEEVEEELEELEQLPLVRRAERSIWSAPDYTPPRWAPVRQGAEAFKAIPRRGIPC